ncbi:MAG: RNA pseudouridine synthase [Spirochaetaceae bacterium]|jgi:23S rRNA pseudouridine1911/1915/1917 synthase|nr:RNA pseudouridine synthase [Spirochaetaceae bacterium]
MFEPNLVDLTDDYLVAYKPPRMHSVFLKKQGGREDREETLLDWCSRLYPEVKDVAGRNPWEGGIVHRLDYETEGLVLFARTQRAIDSFLAQQREGRFGKTYGALSMGPRDAPRGYPPQPPFAAPAGGGSAVIESGFRPYGRGRKTVRPVLNPMLPPEKVYRTGILTIEKQGAFTLFSVWIQRGFRHQIRCHLAWLGFPLVNDPLYDGADFPWQGDGVSPSQSFLALKAQGISFDDPATGKPREYVLPSLLSLPS